MARISKSPLDKKTYREILDTFDIVLGKMKKDEVRLFLFSLLGKNERIMVAKRFAAIVLLKQGVKIKHIANLLNMTEATIRRLSLVVQIKNEGFELALKKVGQDKRKKEFKKLLLELARYSIKSAGGRV